jgi:hypothetical protein
MNPAALARLRYLEAQRAARLGQEDIADEMRRIEAMTQQERAAEYERRMAALETEPPDPVEDARLRSMSAGESVDEYVRTIRRGSR